MNDYTYKKMDSGNKELFSMLIYRPAVNFLLNTIFKNLNVTPNQISFISLLIAIAASWFFAFAAYPYVLIGVALLHLTYIFDMLDGQYARYKGLSSKYGKWFDPFLDTIKLAFLCTTLSFRAYNDNGNYLFFIWGFIALTNSFLTFYILNTRSQIMKGATFEVKPAKNIYVGYEISLYWTLSFFVVINNVCAGLIFLATIGALSWIKCFITLRRYYFRNKEQIENES